MAPPPSSDRFVSMSCSNVGVGPGGTTSMLARVVVVDYKGKVLFDRYVLPTMQVTDYRTSTTGITAAQLIPAHAWQFNAIQQYVANLLEGKVLVGHSLWNDLSVLGIPHPAVNTRDVALYMARMLFQTYATRAHSKHFAQPFRNSLRSPQQVVGLQTLAWQLMCRRCQEGQQHPVENARVALDLYRSDGENWERSISNSNWPCVLPPSTFSRCYL